MKIHLGTALNSVLNKGKSAITSPLFNIPEVLSSATDETKLRTLILTTQVSLYLFSLLEVI